MSRRIVAITILCGAGPHHDYLIARLAMDWRIGCLVREPERNQRAQVKASGRCRDHSAMTYHMLRRRLLGLDRFRRRYFRRLICDLPTVEIPDPLIVDNVNGETALDRVRAVDASLTVVMGTTILKKPMLEAAGPIIINVHGGLLPYYRGNHCVFFALHDRRPDLVGATLHFVDPGVDTGDIIEQVRPAAVQADELPEVAYCRSVHAGVDALVDHLRNFDRGFELPHRPQGPGGRTFRMRDRTIRHDLHYITQCIVFRARRLWSGP